MVEKKDLTGPDLARGISRTDRTDGSMLQGHARSIPKEIHRSLRIAQVAPLYESVPPKFYGGTERVVAYLAEELVRRGHEVTLLASGDSTARAKIQSTYPAALRAAGLPHMGASLQMPLWMRPKNRRGFPDTRRWRGPSLARSLRRNYVFHALARPSCSAEFSLPRGPECRVIFPSATPAHDTSRRMVQGPSLREAHPSRAEGSKSVSQKSVPLQHRTA
jgi:hypothetical protein